MYNSSIVMGYLLDCVFYVRQHIHGLNNGLFSMAMKTSQIDFDTVTWPD